MNMEWQTIETAPLDTPILIWDGSMQCVAKKSIYTYQSGSPFTTWDCVGASGWDCEDTFETPTHWMPLPPPPAVP